MQTGGTEIEKMTNCKHLGQLFVMENATMQEVSLRIKAAWSVFIQYKGIFCTVTFL